MNIEKLNIVEKVAEVVKFLSNCFLEKGARLQYSVSEATPFKHYYRISISFEYIEVNDIIDARSLDIFELIEGLCYKVLFNMARCEYYSNLISK